MAHEVLFWNKQLDEEQGSDIGQACADKEARVSVVALQYVADYVGGEDSAYGSAESGNAGY